MIEINENKSNDLLNCMKKGISYFTKAMDCIESMRTNKRHIDEEDDEDDEYEDDERYARHGSHSSRSRGRYSRY